MTYSGRLIDLAWRLLRPLAPQGCGCQPVGPNKQNQIHWRTNGLTYAPVTHDLERAGYDTTALGVLVDAIRDAQPPITAAEAEEVIRWHAQEAGHAERAVRLETALEAVLYRLATCLQFATLTLDQAAQAMRDCMGNPDSGSSRDPEWRAFPGHDIRFVVPTDPATMVAWSAPWTVYNRPFSETNDVFGWGGPDVRLASAEVVRAYERLDEPEIGWNGGGELGGCCGYHVFAYVYRAWLDQFPLLPAAASYAAFAGLTFDEFEPVYREAVRDATTLDQVDAERAAAVGQTVQTLAALDDGAAHRSGAGR